VFVPLVLYLICILPDFSLSSPAEVTHRARALQPGEVIRLMVKSAEPLKELEARIFERAFVFYPEQNPRSWQGLVGVDLDVKPGRYPVMLTGQTIQGTPIILEYSLSIRPKSFPTRRLAVDEKYVNPPTEALDRIRRESRLVQEIIARVTPDKLWKNSFILPVPGSPISSFGKRSILNGQPRNPHAGVDFEGAIGTPVKSPNGGRVVLSADLYYSGQTVIVDHGLGLYSYFAHLSRISVKEGQSVESGTLIGEIGATGRVTGPHLHWSVRLAETRVDPLSLIAALRSTAAPADRKPNLHLSSDGR
jgi:murein DD-endopeptidase MepM/ murein hydrolase activator NlpD